VYVILLIIILLVAVEPPEVHYCVGLYLPGTVWLFGVLQLPVAV